MHGSLFGRVAGGLLVLVSSLAAAQGEGPACGTTIGPGAITGQTWTTSGSPYCVTGDLDVQSLVIDPGVEVLLSPGVRIDVTGTLVADGTAAAPISFRRPDVVPGMFWNGIHFDHSPPGSSLTFCQIEGTQMLAAVAIENSTPVIASCVIRTHYSPFSSSSWGAVFIDMDDGTDFTLRDCTLVDNSRALYAVLANGSELFVEGCTLADNGNTSGAEAFGGGARIFGDCTWRNCTVRGNRAFGNVNGDIGYADAYGGGIYHSGGSAVIENCQFLENRAEAYSVWHIAFAGGGAIRSSAQPLVLRNSLFAGNGARAFGQISGTETGGGVLAGNVDIVNCTFVHNKVSGLFVGTGGGTVSSSILFFNGVGTGNVQIDGSPTVDHSCVQGGHPGTGNITLDPQLIGMESDALQARIGPSSPCIDLGNPAPAFDDACPEISRGTARNDMGAEGGPQACGFGLKAVAYCTGKTNSLGCIPFLVTTGTASASSPAPFRVTARDLLPGEGSFAIYGAKRAGLDFHGGKLCIKAPFVRLQPTKSARVSGLPPCAGLFTKNFNNRIQGGADPQLSAGVQVHLQVFQRDPLDPAGFGDGLTDAVRFFIQP